jgi:hypothetical protein
MRALERWQPGGAFHNLVGAHSVVVRVVHDEAFRRISIEHFHPEIVAGDTLRWNPIPYDVGSIRTYKVIISVPHPRGVAAVWWAELIAQPPPVYVSGALVSRRA